jgi:hypothetical protein
VNIQLPQARPLLAAALLAVAGCAGEPAGPALASVSAGVTSQATAAPSREIVNVVYDGALGKGWQDYGWAPRELGKGPASLDMSKYGGWIIAHPGLTGRYGALVIHLTAPASYGDFFEVHLASDRKDQFPAILVTKEHRQKLPDGQTQIVLPLRALNPDRLSFDRILLRAAKPVGSERVLLHKIGFTAEGPADAPPPVPTEDVALAIDCRGPGAPISPLIYGIAYSFSDDQRHRQQYSIGATARRWGGNPTSRYNWEHGAAWNTANDWFFQNIDFSGQGGAAYATFLKANLERGMSSALTVPILGWVAKDTTSYSFPVSAHGPQRGTDPYKPHAGDGHAKDGKPLSPGSPSRTSVASTPDSIRRWVEQIRAEDKKRGSRSVHMYILDNEPMLWNSTHRDVHPEPTTYDELLDRTLRHGGLGLARLLLLGEGRGRGLLEEAGSPRARRRPAPRLVPPRALRAPAEDRDTDPRRPGRPLLSAGQGGRRRGRRDRRRDRGPPDSLDARALGLGIQGRVVDRGPRAAPPADEAAHRRELPRPRALDR